MSLPPRISIITPSYNQADFLEQTIRSVLCQDVDELEYIIVDGGSTDGSVEIIRKYEEQLTWWVSEPDRGQAEAINKGLARSRGEIVAWLNSDDLYAPGALREAVKVLAEDQKLGMAYGNAVSIDRNGRPLNDMAFDDWSLEGLAAFNIICQPAVFMRRSTLQKTGFLDPNYHYLLDHHLWLRIAREAAIRHVPSVWAFARFHPAAKNVSQAAGFGQEALRILAWMKSQPVLSEVVAQNNRQVHAAAHRFNARYLLDGGQAWDSFKEYTRALFLHPPTALQEWHRILFAKLSLLGLGKLGDLYYQQKRRRLPVSMREMGVENVASLYHCQQ